MINSENLYVENAAGTRVFTKFIYDDVNMEFEVEPLEAYAQEVDYYLHITTKVKLRGIRNLKEPVAVRFRL